MAEICVIVPVYNVELYLHRCVDSILNQTFTNFELILIDDGSPDSCPIICDEYAKKDPRVKVIHQQNGGLSSARNTGIDWCINNSKCNWLTFIDSDDWIHPEMLNTLYVAVNKNNTAVSVCRGILTSDEKIEEEKINLPELLLTEDAYINEPYSMTAWGKLYRKDCFKNRRYPVGKIHEDEYITYQVLFEHKNISVVKNNLYYYFYNNDGIIKSAWNIKKLAAVEAFEAQLEFFKKNNFKKALKFTMEKYIGNLAYQITQIRLENKEVYIEIEKKLKIKLRKALIFKGGLDIYH